MTKRAVLRSPKVTLDDLPHTRLSAALERFVRRIGEISSYIWLVLVAVIICNVVLRHAFGQGYILFEEIQWHLYAVGFMIGISYAVTRDGHVRVDIFSEHWSLRRRAWMELLGLIFLLAPFVVFVLLFSVGYVERSWTLSEVSAAPGGLGHRWVIKSFLIWGFLLLGVAMLARMIRCAAFLFGTASNRAG